MTHQELADAPGEAACGADQRGAEQAAGQTASNAAQHDGDPGGAEVEFSGGVAEIGVVAHQRERGDAGDDHRGEHGAGGA